MKGGARKNTGPKLGPHGKRIKRNICLTADVWAFLARDGDTASVAAESHVRKSAAFKTWMKRKATT